MNNFAIENKLQQYIDNNYNLPLNLRPILQISTSAKLLVVGPAPGIRAHNTGIPWNDASGERLRSWMSLSKNEFYDVNKVALVSMNFWYPGRNKYGGDNQPDFTQAELWHRPLMQLLPNIELTLLVGHKPQIYFLKERVKCSLTETIKSWREYFPRFIVLPHPSWHNNHWLKEHPWFEIELLPELRKCLKGVLDA